MPKRVSDILKALSPYRDLIIFTVSVLAAMGIWKALIRGDESDDVVYLLDWDISAFFITVAHHTAELAYQCVAWIRDTVHFVAPDRIVFDSGFTTTIAWGCTPIKQSFIWLAMMLTTIGGWKHKIWYIPLGWVLIYIFNFLRIACICLLCEFHPERFVFWHDYVFRLLFYAFMFWLWAEFLGRVVHRPLIS